MIDWELEYERDKKQSIARHGCIRQEALTAVWKIIWIPFRPAPLSSSPSPRILLVSDWGKTRDNGWLRSDIGGQVEERLVSRRDTRVWWRGELSKIKRCFRRISLLAIRQKRESETRDQEEVAAQRTKRSESDQSINFDFLSLRYDYQNVSDKNNTETVRNGSNPRSLRVVFYHELTQFSL